jgi:lycopene cyclase domain-containing protein
MSYLGLNAIFLGAVVLVGLAMRKQLPWRAIFLSTGVLVIATAIFDNLIVGTGIVAYDESLILGIKIGYAPIEDFAYALAAPLLISIATELTKGTKWKP